jgi:hypothetical protein
MINIGGKELSHTEHTKVTENSLMFTSQPLVALCARLSCPMLSG